MLTSKLKALCEELQRCLCPMGKLGHKLGKKYPVSGQNLADGAQEIQEGTRSVCWKLFVSTCQNFPNLFIGTAEQRWPAVKDPRSFV